MSFSMGRSRKLCGGLRAKFLDGWAGWQSSLLIAALSCWKSLQLASMREETAMAYWLVKSEPDSWSWDQQAKAGAKGEAWTGVRNHTAKQNLEKMKKGDRAFFYHSGVGKEI